MNNQNNEWVNDISNIEDKIMETLENFFKNKKILLGVLAVGSLLLMSIK